MNQESSIKNEDTQTEKLTKNVGYKQCQIDLAEIIGREQKTIAQDIEALRRVLSDLESPLKKKDVQYKIYRFEGRMESLRRVLEQLTLMASPYTQ